MPHRFADRTAAERAAEAPLQSDGQIHPTAPGQVHQRLDRVDGRRIDGRIGAEFSRERESLLADFNGDHPCAHGVAKQRRTEAHWSKAEHREGRAPEPGQATERAVGGTGATGDRRARCEAEFLG